MFVSVVSLHFTSSSLIFNFAASRSIFKRSDSKASGVTGTLVFLDFGCCVLLELLDGIGGTDGKCELLDVVGCVMVDVVTAVVVVVAAVVVVSLVSGVNERAEGSNDVTKDG